MMYFTPESCMPAPPMQKESLKESGEKGHTTQSFRQTMWCHRVAIYVYKTPIHSTYMCCCLLWGQKMAPDFCLVFMMKLPEHCAYIIQMLIDRRISFWLSLVLKRGQLNGQLLSGTVCMMAQEGIVIKWLFFILYYWLPRMKLWVGKLDVLILHFSQSSLPLKTRWHYGFLSLICADLHWRMLDRDTKNEKVSWYCLLMILWDVYGFWLMACFPLHIQGINIEVEYHPNLWGFRYL